MDINYYEKELVDGLLYGNFSDGCFKKWEEGKRVTVNSFYDPRNKKIYKI